MVIPGVNTPGMVLYVPYRTQPCNFPYYSAHRPSAENRGHSTDAASEQRRVGGGGLRFAYRFRGLASPPDLVPLIHLSVEHGSGDTVLDESIHRVRAVQLVFFDEIAAR